MIPVKSKESLSWQLIKSKQSESSASIPVLSTFQPVSKALAPKSSALAPKRNSNCPVHNQTNKRSYASSTGGSSRSITSSSHESNDESDSDFNQSTAIDYRSQINQHARVSRQVNQVSHAQNQQQNDQQESNQKIINDLLKSDHIIEEKIHIQLRNGQGLGCSIVRGPSAYPGIFVQSLKANGVARDSGLEVGDQIVGMNGFSFYPGHFDFNEAIKKLKACQQMTLTIRKGIAVNLFMVINQQNKSPISGLIISESQEQSVNQVENQEMDAGVIDCQFSPDANTTCSRCDDCNQQQSMPQLLPRLNRGQERKNVGQSIDSKLVHKIKAIVHQNQDNNSSVHQDNNNHHFDYQRDNETCSNQSKREEASMLESASRLEGASCSKQDNSSKRSLITDEPDNKSSRRGQYKNTMMVDVPNHAKHNQDNNDNNLDNDQYICNDDRVNGVTSVPDNHQSMTMGVHSAGHQRQRPKDHDGRGMIASDNRVCKLHPNGKQQMQTEVKMIQGRQSFYQLDANLDSDADQVINLESSVDLDNDPILERVRLEKEQIAIERKQLEEEQNQIRIQMEQLALERYASHYGLTNCDNNHNFYQWALSKHFDSVKLMTLCVIFFKLILIIVIIVIWLLLFKLPA